MKNVPDSPLGRMYRQHIQLILDKDIDGAAGPVHRRLPAHQQLRQEAALLPRRRPSFASTCRVSSASTDSTPRSCSGRRPTIPQTLMMTEQIVMTTADGRRANMRFADSWVLRDGKIAIHFAGMVQYPDGSCPRPSSRGRLEDHREERHMAPVNAGKSSRTSSSSSTSRRTTAPRSCGSCPTSRTTSTWSGRRRASSTARSASRSSTATSPASQFDRKHEVHGHQDRTDRRHGERLASRST